MKLRRKIAVITGGGTGIGEAIAKLFAEEGAQVVVIGRRKHLLDAVARSITSNGGQALALACSVTAENEVRSAIEQTVRTFGKIDILVNNAGISSFGERLHEVTDRVWLELLDTNLTGVFRVTRAVIPHMLQSGGSILNMSSISGLVGIRKSAAYSATKAALVALTRCLAIDYAQDKIRCNCICPGMVNTPMSADAIADPVMHAAMLQAHPIGRLGTPTDVANLALYLASDESAWVTGSVFTIDGGLTAQ